MHVQQKDAKGFVKSNGPRSPIFLLMHAIFTSGLLSQISAIFMAKIKILSRGAIICSIHSFSCSDVHKVIIYKVNSKFKNRPKKAPKIKQYWCQIFLPKRGPKSVS
jgi:hypothetical protein